MAAFQIFFIALIVGQSAFPLPSAVGDGFLDESVSKRLPKFEPTSFDELDVVENVAVSFHPH